VNVQSRKYIVGLGTFTSESANAKARDLIAVLKRWYLDGRLAGYRVGAIVDEESYDEYDVDPEIVEPRTQGKFPFVYVSITTEEGKPLPEEWAETVTGQGLDPL
jgi:hypothetical protein